jgi:hypothetical protein
VIAAPNQIALSARFRAFDSFLRRNFIEMLRNSLSRRAEECVLSAFLGKMAQVSILAMTMKLAHEEKLSASLALAIVTGVFLDLQLWAQCREFCL